MKDRAMMLRKVAVAGGTLELAPGATIGMAIGPQIAPPGPAAIATARMGTKVQRGIDGTRTSVGRGHRVGWRRRRRVRMRGFLRTQGTMGLVRQARKRFGVVGALTARRDRRGGLRLGRCA